MKNRGARFILASGILAAAISAHGQEPAGGSPAKAPASEPVKTEDVKKDGKALEADKPGSGVELERLSPGPAPRLKPPRPSGPDTLDLLPTDPESVVRNKLLPLVPEAPEALEALGASEGLKARAEGFGDRIKKERNKTEEATDEMALRVRFRQAYTRALSDSEVQQYWNDSKRAKTDYERREFLKKYYGRLYGLMRKADKNLASRIDSEERESVRRLIQKRVEPTVPPPGEAGSGVVPPGASGF